MSNKFVLAVPQIIYEIPVPVCLLAQLVEALADNMVSSSTPHSWDFFSVFSPIPPGGKRMGK